MLPKWHILLGAIFSLILYLFTPFTSFDILIIFLSAVLIDIDHYIGYIIQHKKANPFHSVKWLYKASEHLRKIDKKTRQKYKSLIMFFHSLEFLIILLIATKFSTIAFLILTGFSFHIAIDLIYATFTKQELHPKLSIIYTLVKNKNRETFKF